MRHEVVVRFADACEFVLPVAPAEGTSSEAARRWLDEQFVANECEPLRASGKVLTADKVLALAGAVGAGALRLRPRLGRRLRPRDAGRLGPDDGAGGRVRRDRNVLTARLNAGPQIGRPRGAGRAVRHPNPMSGSLEPSTC